jgi:hypothetical protein
MNAPHPRAQAAAPSRGRSPRGRPSVVLEAGEELARGALPPRAAERVGRDDARGGEGEGLLGEAPPGDEGRERGDARGPAEAVEGEGEEREREAGLQVGAAVDPEPGLGGRGVEREEGDHRGEPDEGRAAARDEGEGGEGGEVEPEGERVVGEGGVSAEEVADEQGEHRGGAVGGAGREGVVGGGAPREVVARGAAEGGEEVAAVVEEPVVREDVVVVDPRAVEGGEGDERHGQGEAEGDGCARGKGVRHRALGD